MPKALAFIGGGLLQGVGKGLVLTGQEKRERALETLRQQGRLDVVDRGTKGRRGLLSQRLASDRDLAAQREEGARGRLELNIGSRERVAGEATGSRERLASEATASREKIASEANKSRERIASGKASTHDTSAAEKRIIEAHTQINDAGFETVDHEAAARDMDARGFAAGAKAARARAKAIDDQDNRTTAEAQADAEVEEKASTFSTDAADFKEDGGSRARFRARRVREIMAELSGKAADGQGGGILDVAGTKEARKKQLSNMPVGTKFRLGGKVYVKRAGGFEPVGAP